VGAPMVASEPIVSRFKRWLLSERIQQTSWILGERNSFWEIR
jgi:hypothetical protein